MLNSTNKFRVLFQNEAELFQTSNFAYDYIRTLKNRHRGAKLRKLELDYATGITTFKVSY